MNEFLKKYLPEILFTAGFFIATAILNLQFLEGSNVNFTFTGHDEYLTVYEVNSILNPPSFKHFFMAVVSGNVLYYGRMMFYTDALFAFLPYKIWGITGMVYAIRMTHVLFLTAGIMLLSCTFLRNQFAKVVFLGVLFTLYYTAYFVMIPKPEPLQLFLLSIFLYYGNKNSWRFGKHFIFLGMAYGLKFNVLTLLPLFFLLPFFVSSVKLIDILKSCGFFLTGLLVAVPALIMAPIKPIFLRSYLASTFGNTSHYDDTGATPLDWLRDGWLNFYSGGLIFGAFTVILIVWVLVAAIKPFINRKQVYPSVILLLVGLSIFIPVILFTKRMWPHYLWTGYLFLILGITSFTHHSFRSKTYERVYSFILVILLVGALLKAADRIPPLFGLEGRSTDLVNASTEVRTYLCNTQPQFSAIQDLSVYYQFKDFVKIKRYHPFATTYPFSEPAQKFVWSPFINPAILSEGNYNYLLVYKRDFEKKHPTNNTMHDKLVLKDDSLMNAQLGKTVTLDTIIGKVKVYKLVNGNF